MNSLFTKKAMKFNSLTNKDGLKNHLSTPLITAAFLSVFSVNAFANRPAMDDQPAPAEPVNQDKMQYGEGSVQNRPEAEAPSAVEAMMQRQSQQNVYTQQSGDVLQLAPKEIQPGETIKIQLLDSPRRGMSMEKVQQNYGQPMAMSEAVGEPPISRWTYNDRIVYFEYSTVLHVVAR